MKTFMEALFIIVKNWKNLSINRTAKKKKKPGILYNELLLTSKKGPLLIDTTT